MMQPLAICQVSFHQQAGLVRLEYATGGQGLELPHVVGPGNQLLIPARLSQHQVLHQKLDIRNPSRILLDIELPACGA